MTTVTEEVDGPAGVDAARAVATIQLIGAGNVPLKEAYSGGKTIAGRHVVTLDGTTTESPAVGKWSLDLKPNTQITPAGTVWGRTLVGTNIDGALSYASVPISGTPTWDAIQAVPPADLPLQASNELQYVQLTTDTSALTVPNFLSVAAVPNTVFTVGDLPRPILFRGQLQLTASVTGIGIYTAYGPVGAALGDVFGPDWVPSVGTAGSSRITSAPRHRLNPHTPSTVQLYVGTDTFSSVNITVRSAAQSLTWVGAESR